MAAVGREAGADSADRRMSIMGPQPDDRIRTTECRVSKRKLITVLRPTTKDGHAGQLSPSGMLVAMLVKHTGRDGIEVEHLYELFDMAVAAAGSISGAIEALESGRMNLERIVDEQA